MAAPGPRTLAGKGVSRQELENERKDMHVHRKLLIFLMVSLLAVFIWSAINPHDYFTWFLEVLPAMVGLIILAGTYKKFPFTPLVYGLIWLHMIVLMVGGHYTYAEVPLFDWLKPVFGWTRNN
jgi:putative membrane protein